MLLLSQTKNTRPFIAIGSATLSNHKKKSPFIIKDSFKNKVDPPAHRKIKKKDSFINTIPSQVDHHQKFRSVQTPRKNIKQHQESLSSIFPQLTPKYSLETVVGSIKVGRSKQQIHFSQIRSKMLKKSFKDYLKDKYNILPFLATPYYVTSFLKDLKQEDLEFIEKWFLNNTIDSDIVFGQLEQLYFDKSDFIQLQPFLFSFLSYLLEHHLSQVQFSKKMRNLTDLDNPHLWYRTCRKIKRKLIYHVGQTNSGKTHAAFQRLVQAETGVYLAPLRLLAWEGQQKMQAEGVVCDLITGQERIINEAGRATHQSMTIESLSLDRYFQVAVIDEVQLIGDRERGGAWTRAILGLQSKEVHICGDHRALPLLTHFCQLTGDTLEIVEHHRLSKLSVDQTKLFDLKQDLQEGDCLISFSSPTLYHLRNLINNLGGGHNSCGIIYGRLPPETRKMQASRFNLRQQGIKYMLATDAIGLGLNLTINRVIFWDMVKQSMDQQGIMTSKLLDAFSVRQIAGRAGRYLNDGLVLARSDHHQKYIHQCLTDPPRAQISAGICPSWEQISQFVESVQERTEHITFYQAFTLLTQNITTDSRLFLQGDESMVKLAYLLRHRKIDTRLAYTLCQAPVELACLKKTAQGFQVSNHSASLIHFNRYVDQLLKYNKVLLYPGLNSPRSYHPRLHSIKNIKYFQDLHQQLSLYQWLYHKFSDACQDIDACLKRLDQCGHIIDDILHKNQ